MAELTGDTSAGFGAATGTTPKPRIATKGNGVAAALLQNDRILNELCTAARNDYEMAQYHLDAMDKVFVDSKTAVNGNNVAHAQLLADAARAVYKDAATAVGLDIDAKDEDFDVPAAESHQGSKGPMLDARPVASSTNDPFKDLHFSDVDYDFVPQPVDGPLRVAAAAAFARVQAAHTTRTRKEIIASLKQTSWGDRKPSLDSPIRVDNTQGGWTAWFWTSQRPTILAQLGVTQPQAEVLYTACLETLCEYVEEFGLTEEMGAGGTWEKVLYNATTDPKNDLSPLYVSNPLLRLFLALLVYRSNCSEIPYVYALFTDDLKHKLIYSHRKGTPTTTTQDAQNAMRRALHNAATHPEPREFVGMQLFLDPKHSISLTKQTLPTATARCTKDVTDPHPTQSKKEAALHSAGIALLDDVDVEGLSDMISDARALRLFELVKTLTVQQDYRLAHPIDEDMAKIRNDSVHPWPRTLSPFVSGGWRGMLAVTQMISTLYMIEESQDKVGASEESAIVAECIRHATRCDSPLRMYLPHKVDTALNTPAGRTLLFYYGIMTFVQEDNPDKPMYNLDVFTLEWMTSPQVKQVIRWVVALEFAHFHPRAQRHTRQDDDLLVQEKERREAAYFSSAETSKKQYRAERAQHVASQQTELESAGPETKRALVATPSVALAVPMTDADADARLEAFDPLAASMKRMVDENNARMSANVQAGLQSLLARGAQMGGKRPQAAAQAAVGAPAAKKPKALPAPKKRSKGARKAAPATQASREVVSSSDDSSDTDA